MAENLKYEAPGSKCYSDLDINCTTYGRLYNWPTIMSGSPSSAALPSEVQGICPDGWHLPSDAEWAILINYAGGTQAGTQLKASDVSWSTNRGTDYYGFSALPGGRGTSGGSFELNSTYGYWWSASESGSFAYARYMYGGYTYVSRDDYNKGNFYSVRCVKDGYIPPSSPSHPNSGTPLTDSRDSKTYRTIKIGTQTWMAENLNYDATGSVCYTNNKANCNTYGRLYTWATALTVCPTGWHLPLDVEWATLVSYAGSIEGTQLKANSILWANNTGTDALGFSALPGGRGTSGGSFELASTYGYWWSASENGSLAYARYIYGGYTYVSRDDYNKGNFYSVRCIQDSEQ